MALISTSGFSVLAEQSRHPAHNPLDVYLQSSRQPASPRHASGEHTHQSSNRLPIKTHRAIAQSANDHLQPRADLVDQQRCDIGQTSHVTKRKYRPPPRICLAANNHQGRGALSAQGKEDHNR